MPLLTSPGCDGCLHMSQRITELEERVSTLRQLKECEQFLDSFTVTVGATAHTSGQEELDSTVPLLDPAFPPVWPKEGARPKEPSRALVSSTPNRANPWSIIHGGKHKRKHLSCPSPSKQIPLSNRYSTLEENSPPVLTKSHTSPQKSHRRPSVLRPGHVRFTASPVPSRPSTSTHLPGETRVRHGGLGNSAHSPKEDNSSPVSLPRPPGLPGARRSDVVPHNACPGCSKQRSPPPPLTIIIGDSIVRNVSINNAHTVSFPGATVAVITEKIQDVALSFPDADTLVLHVGTNDVGKRQSELLKRDFIRLFGVLEHFHYSVSISGPTPTSGRGFGRFSRLLSLNTWLQSACRVHNVHFIDNFNLFWERGDLFTADGLHLNSAGARALSSNLSYWIRHHCIPTRVSHQTQTETETVPAPLPSSDRSLTF